MKASSESAVISADLLELPSQTTGYQNRSAYVSDMSFEEGVLLVELISEP